MTQPQPQPQPGPWNPATPEAARRAAWDDDDWDGGIRRCLWELASLEPVLERPGARVIDVGCGPGRLLVPVARRHPGATVIGLDPSPAMLAPAARAATAAAIRNVRTVLGDVATVPRLAPVDGAWSVLTLQHLPRLAQRGYVRALAAALTPGGVLRLQFVTTGDDGPLNYPVTLDEFGGWCAAAGLSVVSLAAGAVFPAWGWVTATR